MNSKNVLSMSKSKPSNQDCGNEKRVEMVRKITELLSVNYVEGKYHVTIWNFAISKGFDTQEEAIRLIEEKDIDMLITAMYGIGSQLVKEATDKINEKLEYSKKEK